jgi:hypothetical protein
VSAPPILATVTAFPPRSAGRVLADALDAAFAAADAEAKTQHARLIEPWCAPSPDPAPRILVEQAAYTAAAAVLHDLTADRRMVDIVAAGMAVEAVARLRKAGAQ